MKKCNCKGRKQSFSIRARPLMSAAILCAAQGFPSSCYSWAAKEKWHFTITERHIGKHSPPSSSSNSCRGGCFVPCFHILTVTYLHTAIPKPHQQKSKEERGQTKYHKKIFVFHPKINAPCHFGKTLMDFYFFFSFIIFLADSLIQVPLRKWEQFHRLQWGSGSSPS